MAETFISLDKTDSRFRDYLMGTFSKTMRALPVTTFVGSEKQERITFRIVPVHTIRKPPMWVVWAKLLRMDRLHLMWVPALATLLYLQKEYVSIDWHEAGLALLALTGFHFSAHCLNEFFDHVGGHDRLLLHSGTRVIQQGWLKARTVFRAGFVFLGFAATIGVRALLLQPEFLILVSAFAAVSVIGFAFRGQGLRALGLGELIIFSGFGAFITYGISRASAHHHDLNILFLGFYFGWWSMMIWQLRDLNRMLMDRSTTHGTLMSRLGYERGKLLLNLELAFSFVFLGLLFWQLYIWLAPLLVLNLFCVLILRRFLAGSPSPLASTSQRLLPAGVLCHLLLGLGYLVCAGAGWFWNY